MHLHRHDHAWCLVLVRTGVSTVAQLIVAIKLQQKEVVKFLTGNHESKVKFRPQRIYRKCVRWSTYNSGEDCSSFS